MNIKCLKCKGRGFCGRTMCAHYAKLNSLAKAKHAHDKTEFTGQSPAPFIGHFGYPNVNVGLLSPPEGVWDAWKFDAPNLWAEKNYSLSQLVDIRSSLLNTKATASVRNPEKITENAREVGLSSKPVEMDFNLEEKPRFRLQADTVSPPMGPSAKLKSAQTAENPKVKRKVEKVYSDTDMKSIDAMSYLYKHGFNENFLSKVLSVGAIGQGTSRKLVPTRWSITATDDTIGKQLISEVSEHPDLNEYLAYFGEYLGNNYLIFLFPGLWGYELFETCMPRTGWHTSSDVEYTTDYETHQGRKSYAENCAGGYYTVRLAVLEKLRKMKRKASCVVIRVITGDYSVPLGVWVTREASRKALENKPLSFSEKSLMVKYAKLILNKKFAMPQGSIINDSRLLKAQQKTLAGF
ncbi:MAG: hypothetical protein ACOCZQ_01655 [Nanoarchaeota archaeon]